MTDFIHYIVCDIDDVVYRAQSDVFKSRSHPFRRRSGLEVADFETEIVQAARSFDLDLEFFVNSVSLDTRVFEFAFPRKFEYRPDLTRYSVVTPEVGPVVYRLVFDLDHEILSVEHFFERNADLCCRIEHHDARMIGAESKLVFSADHAAAFNSADLCRFDLEIAGKDCSERSKRDSLTFSKVGSAADDGLFFRSVKNGRKMKVVGIGMILDFYDFRSDDLVEVLEKPLGILDFRRFHSQLFCDLFSSDAAQIYVVIKPVQR